MINVSNSGIVISQAQQKRNASIYFIPSRGLPATYPWSLQHASETIETVCRICTELTACVHVVMKTLFVSSGRRRPGSLQSVSHASSVQAADAEGGVGRECLESTV